MIVEFAADDFVGGIADGVGNFWVQVFQRDVCKRCGLFDNSERVDQGQGHTFAADLEVFERALRLGAPVFVGGDWDRAKGIGFSACFGHIYFLRKRSRLTTVGSVGSLGSLSAGGGGAGATGAATGLAEGVGPTLV